VEAVKVPEESEEELSQSNLPLTVRQAQTGFWSKVVQNWEVLEFPNLGLARIEVEGRRSME
jgi:hypothetical protein